MAEDPKRTLGDSIGQLVVILVLIAVLVGAVILLRQFFDSHESSQQGLVANALVIGIRR